MTEQILLPDEQEEIEKCLCKLCDEKRADLVFDDRRYGFFL